MLALLSPLTPAGAPMTRRVITVLAVLALACACADSRGDGPPAPAPAAAPAPTPAPRAPAALPAGPAALWILPLAAAPPPQGPIERGGARAPSPPEPAPSATAARWPTWWPACAHDDACPETRGAWRESARGYAHRWLVAPASGRARKEQRPARLAAALAADLAPRAFAGDVVELAPSGRPKRGASAPVYVLAARVHAEGDVDAVLRTGVTGRATIELAGATVYERQSDDLLLPDHERVPVHLKAGWSDVIVRLEQLPPAALAFTLRLRGRDGLPIPGLAWGLPEPHAAAAAGAPCDALALAIAQTPVPGGYELEATATAATLLPPGEHRWRWSRGGATLAEAPLDLAALALGGAQALSARAPDGGPGDVELAIDGAVCARRPLTMPAALRDRFLAARAAVTALPASLAAGTRDSLAYAVQRLGAHLGGDGASEAVVREELDTLEALVTAAEGGADPYLDRVGVVVRAYRSDLDGSLQPYVLLVPPSYLRRKGRAFPLIVAAHGLFYTPEAMVRIISGKPAGPGPWRRGEDFAFRDVGALIVAPDGYGNAGHRAPGERDLLRVIAEVRAAYRVDADRVSLTGFSLGGSVGFWLPFHHPGLFSAAAPLCGYPNVPEYRTVRAVKRRPFEEVLLAAENIVNYAENGRYVPLRIVHGARDQPERSEMVVDRYEALRYPVDFEVVPDAGHNIWDKAFEDTALVDWLARQERPELAKSPRLRTARYRWDQAYWLRLDHFARYGAFAELEGKLRDKTLAVTTDNADAFTILAAELGPVAGERRSLSVDGQPLGEVALAGDLHLVRDGKAWRLADAPPPSAGRKRHGVEGPLRDVWSAPFVVVWGASDAAEADANRLTAEAVRRYNPWTELAMPMIADTEVTAAELRGRGVVLVGGPRGNRVVRELEGRLPVKFEDGALVFGGKRYEGDGVGISTILPSPFDPEQVLVLHAGVGPEGTLSARYLPEWVPDWIIYDDGLRATWWDYFLGKRSILAGGFYDERWRLP